MKNNKTNKDGVKHPLINLIQDLNRDSAIL